MKSTFFSILSLLFIHNVVGQIYVSDNSYVYNKGSLVYAQGNLELNGTNSNFYLRNDGQFLQGTTGSSTNRGSGNLSVYQEGTANNFGYNYWCSPVGLSSITVGNADFQLNQTIKRPVDKINFQNPTFTSSYNGTTTNSALTISNQWLYKYTAANNYSNWVYVGQSGNVASGLGFTMKGVSGDDTLAGIDEVTFNNPTGAGGLNDYQRYDFRGKPNDGTISISVAGPTGADQYPNSTLTGNPYPSAINLNLFLLENSGYTINYTNGTFSVGGTNVINGNAYFWEHEKPATSHILVQYIGGYGIYVPNNTNVYSPGTYNNASWNTYNADGSLNTQGSAGGTSLYKRMFCPIGQGFMIEGTTNGNAIMKNSYRTFVKEGALNESEFNKLSATSVSLENWTEIPNLSGTDYTQFSKKLVPQIKIHTLVNNQFTKELTICFNPNTTDGYDRAMDAESYESNLPIDAYFSLPDSSYKEYVITTLPFNIEKRIPFTLKTNNQTNFKVTAGDIINFHETDTIYLFDKLSGTYYDIKNDYFEITLAEGLYKNRFEITFTNGTLSSTSAEINSNFTILQNNSRQELTILNPNILEIKEIQLFEITGKLIYKKAKLEPSSSHKISTSELSNGVYFVTIETKNGKKITQKIIVSPN